MSLTIRRLPEQDNNLLRPPSSISPAQNGDVVLEATSNSVLTMKLKGTDGVVRNFDVGGGGSTIGTEYDIGNAEDCQARCAENLYEHGHCYAFNWFGHDNKCRLFTECLPSGEIGRAHV